MSEKYKTKTQLLLKILHNEAVENLELSNDRMNYFKKEMDFETLAIERGTNHEYRSKVDKLEKLIELEKGWSSSRPTIVQIGFLNNDGTEKFVTNIISEKIKEV